MEWSKKRKIGDECRQFQEEWRLKYFFAKHGEKALCVICNEIVSVLKEYNLRRHYQTKHEEKYRQWEGEERSEKFSKLHHQISFQKAMFTKLSDDNESVTNASYKVAYILAKRGKPFTDGELVKECMLEVAQELCPEMLKKFSNLTLSATTIARRVEDIGENIVDQLKKSATNFRYFSIAMDESLDISSTSQLLVFIRGVDEKLNVTQELADMHSMYGTVTGEDIFTKLLKTFSESNLDWSNFSCLTIDGGKNMSGVKKGLVGLVKEECKKRNVPQPMFVHCMIHQQALCAKYLDISCVLQPVVKIVNYIRSHGLNHRQFRILLKDNESDFQDLPYYTTVRWLSCGKLLTRMLEIRKDVMEFLETKGKPEPLLNDENWLWKLAFAADITTHLNLLNLKLQGQENFISDLYVHIKAFRLKLRLFLQQLQIKNLTHFPECHKLKEQAKAEFPVNYACDLISNLQKQFNERFAELDERASEIRIFQNPFEAVVLDCPNEIQLELLEIQANDNLKDKFKEGLIDFYKFLPKTDFPNMKDFACKYVSLFGTTYLCEQTFSRMKYVKNNLRSNLTDNHLKSLLTIGTSNLKPEVSAITASKKQFHHSH
uniref:SPIN-DOC-like zinc-finger domain-containing protein n=1 Tax=Anopheles atroparvus TaxID=41427 RepID=A0AAG5DQE7_ANOAO